MRIFKKIHKDILKKSFEFISLRSEIKINGMIEIEKSDLDLFCFLFKTIISQQISVKVATLIWERICLKLKVKRLELNDFSDKKKLKTLLEEVKISSLKTDYILRIYDDFKLNKISDDQIKKLDETNIRSLLMQYRGVGSWTCDMVLIFFLGYLNIFPRNDLIIKKVLIKIQEIESQTIDFEKKFSPYLSIFSLHLWKMSKRIL